MQVIQEFDIKLYIQNNIQPKNLSLTRLKYVMPKIANE